MKKIALILAVTLALSLFAGCSAQESVQTDPATVPADTTPETTAAPTETPTEAPTEAPTEQEPMSDIDPMGLVGDWKRTHAEVEGDKSPNTKGSLTIAGADSGSLTLTFKDKETSNFNIKEKALEIKAGQLFDGCGNDIWYAEATSGKNTYALTMLDDDTILLQLIFDFDGQPMVSTQWFTRSK